MRPKVPRADVADFVTATDSKKMTLAEYVNDPGVDGLLILHKGQIVFEAYPRMLDTDKHLQMSVSKTFVATLIAILEDNGKIDISKPIDSYLPKLAGSGWEGVPVIDVLDMASGIGCLEGEEEALSMTPYSGKCCPSSLQYVAASRVRLHIGSNSVLDC